MQPPSISACSHSDNTGGCYQSHRHPLQCPPGHPDHALPGTATPYLQLLQEAQVTESAGLQPANVVHAQISSGEERQKSLISHAVVCTE